MRTNRMIAACVVVAPFQYGCAPPGSFDKAYTVVGRNSGVTISEEECLPVDTSVWVIVEGKGECVRYFTSGVGSDNKLVHVWFHGDKMRVSEARYNSMTPW